MHLPGHGINVGGWSGASQELCLHRRQLARAPGLLNDALVVSGVRGDRGRRGGDVLRALDDGGLGVLVRL
jgi:hypothetical protein